MSTPKETKKNSYGDINTEIIFLRVLYLNSTEKIKINEVSNEVAPTQTVLFKDTGGRRYPTSKADLKIVLKVKTYFERPNLEMGGKGIQKMEVVTFFLHKW